MEMLSFPFSAVQGQASFKLALILCAINPAIGGVLVSGPRGSAKSTLARGLADIMPGSAHHAFVTLPLGATEDMLVGTLDLKKVLANKEVCFNPGLLAKAHAGVLYVDEVNLLADTLVDLLLDVSVSGVNHVERDGISHAHDSKFILLGTMNPDEGELRPQLQDRFGLAVELTGGYAKQERIDIVKLRESFDNDPAAFVASFDSQQQDIIKAIESARLCVKQVTISDALRGDIAERCEQANVDGLRADIVWLRAALAYAALNGQKAVCLDDLDAVEELVLSHRRKPNSHSGKPPSTPPTKNFSRPQQPSAQESSQNKEADNGDWGSMPPEVQKTADCITGNINCLMTELPLKIVRKTAPLYSKKKGSAQGTQNLQKSVKSKSTSVHWFGTLINSAGQWPLKQLFFRQTRKVQPVLHMVLLDTSASMLYANGFAKAKAAVLNIAEQAYLQREQLTIVGFGNDQVDLLLPSVRAPKLLRAWLDGIRAGGGTPLRDGLHKAKHYQQLAVRKTAGIQIKSYLITDGKTADDLRGLDLLGGTLIIDTEQSDIKRGNAQRLAEQLGADYSPLMT